MADSPRNPPATDAAPPPAKRERPKVKTSYPLPTERIAFTKQQEILRAIGQLGSAGGAVPNGKVADIVRLHPSTVTLANPFFQSVGFIARSAEGQIPSSAVIEFARHFEWDSKQAPLKLAPQLEGAWFTSALLPNVRFRPHTRSEALTVLADACGAAQENRGQLETILEWLELTGLIVREGDLLKAPAAAPNRSKVVSVVDANGATPAPGGAPAPLPVAQGAEQRHQLNMSGRRSAVLVIPEPFTEKDINAIWKQLKALQPFLISRLEVDSDPDDDADPLWDLQDEAAP